MITVHLEYLLFKTCILELSFEANENYFCSKLLYTPLSWVVWEGDDTSDGEVGSTGFPSPEPPDPVTEALIS